MITGQKLQRPTKQGIADEIAISVGIPRPHTSTGSSVESAFLDALFEWRTGLQNPGTDANRKTAFLLEALGLTYDPFWDTSEISESGGGSTVTTRAYSRIRSALTGTPRCFIFKVNDAPVGSRWETNHSEVYRYGRNVTAHKALNDAGPGSKVIYYATRNASSHPRHFIASANIAYISPDWDGPWEAQLESYRDFTTPVPYTDFTLPGDNQQHAITEITLSTYNQLVVRGGQVASAEHPLLARVESDDEFDETPDASGVNVARRIVQNFPIDVSLIDLRVPSTLPTGAFAAEPPQSPNYSESPEGVLLNAILSPRPSRDPGANKLAETRAIEIVKAALAKDGWSLKADRQKDGTGFDLEFVNASRKLKVEVKGIRGHGLTFNLTPKELWRAETDPDWVLVAVTNVLSAGSYKVTLVTRDRITAASKQIAGFRLNLNMP